MESIMKNLNLNVFGVEEMTEVELKETEGGIMYLLAANIIMCALTAQKLY